MSRALHDVIVLGVGGMGAAALAHLAARSVRVVGIEQDDVPSLRGSSVGETRIIRKAYFEDARYVPLLHRAYALWTELERERNEELFVRTGCLNLGPPSHPDIQGVLRSVEQHRLAHTRLDAEDVRRHFPAFTPSPSDVGVHEEDAGYLKVEACTRAHAELAVARGAELRTRTTVTAVALDSDAVRVSVAGGDTFEAERLVVSAGAWLASPLLAGIARDLPALTVTRQVQLWFRPRDEAIARAPAMPAFIHFASDRAFYGVPLGDPLPCTPSEPGVKVCRHHGGERTTAQELDRAPRPEDEGEVRQYLAAHLRNVDGPLVHRQVCMYTSTPDHHFIVGLHPRDPRVVILGGFSGHGYKMASVMGEVAAELAIDGRTKLDISLFQPARFRRADRASAARAPSGRERG